VSKGTRIIGIRVPDALRAKIETAVTRSEQSATREPFTLTTFILAAIREKLDHMARSRRPGRRRKQATPPDVSGG
jgi:hypothetical protein